MYSYKKYSIVPFSSLFFAFSNYSDDVHRDINPTWVNLEKKIKPQEKFCDIAFTP